MDRSSSVVIVSPALAAANNGNWQTARRWAQWLRPVAPVRITDRWPDDKAGGDGVMLALHAVRSAAAVAQWRARRRGGLAVVLTGTDLYGDFADDVRRDESLAAADRLVVLQDQAIPALPGAVRAKARVIYQSVPARAAVPKSTRRLLAAVVGHLRDVKGPETVLDAVHRLGDGSGIAWRHAGAAEGSWKVRVQQVQAAHPSYQWIGPLPHTEARRLIQRAHVLVHPSHAEGGAHVIMEAACSGTPVLASRIPGNVGMLGEDYEGYFADGDAQGLADLLLACRAGQAGQDPRGGLLERLRAQCALRAPLFAPEAECAALRALVRDLQDCK